MALPSIQQLEPNLHLIHIAACVALAGMGVVVPGPWRARALALLGVLFAVVFAPEACPARALLFLVVFGLMHGLGRIQSQDKRWRVALGLIVAVIVIFLAVRAGSYDQTGIVVGGRSWLFFALDMWALLRVVSLFWEVGSSAIGPLDPIVFLAWMALPFTTLGPLIRPKEFQSSLAAPRGTVPPRPNRWRNVLLAVCCLVALWAMSVVFGSSPPTSMAMKLVDGFGRSPWGFYLSSAGLYGLMEACGDAWGLRIPTSFNFPFGRRNIADFWANWNMTATNVMRDYLFFARWGRKRPNFFVNSIVVFLVVGAWHGSNAYWLMFGLYHGVGYSVFLGLKTRKVRPLPGRLGLVTAVVVTYVFVCAGWLLPASVVKLAGHLASR